MKQDYESPNMEVIELDNRDCIVASNPGDTDVSQGGEGGWLG